MSPQERSFVEAIAEALKPLDRRVSWLERTMYGFVGAVGFGGFCIMTGLIKVGG